MKCSMCHEDLDGGLFGLWGRCINPHCVKYHHHDHDNIPCVEHIPDGKITEDFIAAVSKAEKEIVLSGTYDPALHSLYDYPTVPFLSGTYDMKYMDKAGELYCPYIPSLVVEHLLKEKLELNKLKNKEIV